MTLPELRNLLLFCSIANYALLIVWGFIFLGPFAIVREKISLRCRVSPQQFDSVNLSGMVLYKTAIIFFNIIPLAGLWLAV